MHLAGVEYYIVFHVRLLSRNKVVDRQEEKSNSLECDRIVFRCQEKRIGRGGNLFLALPVIDTRGSIYILFNILTSAHIAAGF